MSKKHSSLTAFLALLTLVIVVFATITTQHVTVEAKIVSQKGVSKNCEKYKTLYVGGSLTKSLGSQDKAKKAITECKSKYPDFWYSSPTIQECMTLKKKLSKSNAAYCAKNYPYLWYGGKTAVSDTECYAYKWLVESGGSLTKFLNNKADKAGKVMIQCTLKIDWPQKEVYINNDTCLEYRKYLKNGVLTDLVNKGKANMKIAYKCSETYTYVWNGVTKAECEQFKTWQQQMALTSQLGSVEKASDAITACSYYGYGIFN